MKIEEHNQLKSNDPRLIFKWRWGQFGAGSQVSKAGLSNTLWQFEAIAWGGDNLSYEARISYCGDHIRSHRDFATRIEAQIDAEKLLFDFIDETKRYLNHPPNGVRR